MSENTSKLSFTNARLLAVQTIYAHMMGEADWDKLMSRGLLGELGGKALIEKDGNEEYVSLPSADAGLYTRIVESYREHADDIDTAIKTGLSDNISFDRLEPTFLCILRAGLAEFYADSDTPSAIIINEYVDLTRSFYDGSEIKIANALLDRFSKVIRG
ncbi:MAG: transcription antitermination protein NusB [Alphaproteobacteria bacterium]|nr:transcription antitermination protein NusB [Alphaproteobacteria bacterium]